MIHAYMGYLHTVLNWAGTTDSNNDVNNYWFIFLAPGIFIIGLFTWAGGAHGFYKRGGRQTRHQYGNIKKTWAGVIRGFILGILVMAFWPYVWWALVPVGATVLVVALVCGFLWAFVLDLVPSKDERVAKKRAKVADLRGEVAEVRSK